MKMRKVLGAAAALLCPALVLAQPQDFCFNAAPLSPNGVPIDIDFSAATLDALSSCTPVGEADVWFSYTAPANFGGALVATVSAPLLVSFYKACPQIPEDLTGLVSCFTTSPGHVFLTPGATYYVRVAAPPGTLTGQVAFSTRLPGNDRCDIGLPLIPDVPNDTHVDFAFAKHDNDTTCGPLIDRDIWFTYSAPAYTRLFIDPSNNFPQGFFSYYAACPSSPTDTSGQLACVVSNNGSPVQMDFVAAGTYRVRFATVEGGGSSYGTLNFTTRPLNDNCADAVPFVLGSPIGVAASLATKDGASTCGGNRDVWFSYTPATTGTLEVRPAGSIAAPRVSLHSACPASPTDTSTEIACLATPGGGAFMVFPVNAGQNYLIRFSTDDGGTFNASATFNQLTPPANNTCAASVPAISTGVAQAFNLTGATSDNVSSCGAGFWDVWYRWTATFTGTAAASLSVPNFGLAVFASCPLSSTDVNSEIDCISFTGNQQLTFSAVSGTTYYLRLSRTSAGTATTGGNVTIAQQSPVPANNACATPTVLTAGAAATNFTLVGATRDGTLTTAASSRGNPDLWYAYTPTTSGGATVTIGGAIAGSASAPTIGVFTACPANPNDASTQVASVAATGVPGRSLTFAATAGQTYLIRVARRNGGTTNIATGTIAVTAITPAANDLCSGAIPVFSGVNTADVSGAVFTDPAPSACGGPREVWYAYDAPPGVASITVDITGSNGATVSAYESSCAGAEIACSPSLICFPVTTGTRYLLRVSRVMFLTGGTSALPNTFNLRINEFASFPSNDRCTSAQIVSEGSHAWSTFGGCQDITPDPGVTCGSGTDVWFQYNPSATGTARASILGNIGNLTRHASCGGPILACDDTTIYPPIDVVTLTFPTTLGTPVFLRVAANNASASNLVIEQAFAPGNDECENALPIEAGFTFFDTTDATNSGYVDQCAIGGGKDLWFTYTPPRSGKVFFDTCTRAFTDSTGSYPAFDGSIWAISNISIFTSCGVPVRCSNPNDPNQDTCAVPEAFRYPSLVYGPFYGSPTLLIRVGTDINGAGTGRLYVRFDPTLCGGDFNNNGFVSVQDIFDFLTAYFSGSPTADINQSGVNTVQDIFDFLGAFFIGCP